MMDEEDGEINEVYILEIFIFYVKELGFGYVLYILLSNDKNIW